MHPILGAKFGYRKGIPNHNPAHNIKTKGANVWNLQNEGTYTIDREKGKLNQL